MSQTKVVRGVATSVVRLRDGLAAVYHGTTVATRRFNVVTLDSGGWRTATTKLRINQFANQFCGGKFQVWQDKGEWFVGHGGVVEPFEDGMEFELGEGS